MVATIGHNEFINSDPIRNPLSKKLHATAKEAADYMGTYTMAHIALAGCAYFDLGKLSKQQLTLQGKSHIKKENKKDVSSSDEVEEDSNYEKDCHIEGMTQAIGQLIDDNTLPTVEEVQSILKKAFTSLKDNEHLLLQSILPDLYVLQPWTKPLDYQEKIMLQKMQFSEMIRGKTIDLTNGDSEEDDDFKSLEVEKVSKSKSKQKNIDKLLKKPINQSTSSQQQILSTVVVDSITSQTTPTQKQPIPRILGTKSAEKDQERSHATSTSSSSLSKIFKYISNQFIHK